MNNKYFLSVLFLTGFAAAVSLQLCSAGVFDKEMQSENLYGQGVHAFFNGEYETAAGLFKQSEKLSSQDPRTYFFLALSYHRLLKEDLAETTFKKAAELEWEGQKFRDYNVSDSLRRIQGKERIYVEKFREQAKKNWQNQETKRRSELYGKEQAKDDAVLKALAGSFVGAAPFGAKSLHPFRTENDLKENSEIPADDLIPQASAKPSAKPEAPKPVFIKPAQEEKPSITVPEMEENKPAQPATEEKTEEKKQDEDKKDSTPEQKEEKKEEKKDSNDEDPFA
ncbi:hypothetical protein FACS18942_02790 [Planctomycetales bacterium]|nr:hypothetical protein FACS18942_02790 [Planctomycetales bacterium]